MIHVMERVTLSHIGEEVDADTLTQLGHSLTASMAHTGVASTPRVQGSTSLVPWRRSRFARRWPKQGAMWYERRGCWD
jgi:hypothetical protein